MGKRVPIAWRVEGNKLIPIEWDEDGRILKAIKEAIKYIEKIEKRKRELDKILDKLPRRELTF